MAQHRQTTASDRALTISTEGRINYVYDDAYSPTRKYVAGTKIKGNLTGGVGHLLSRGPSIFPEAKQWIGKTIPANVIDAWLDQDNDEAEAAVDKLVTVPLNGNQYGALVDFTFNIGVGGFENSTLLRKLNKGDYNAVPAELRKYNKTHINGVLVTSNGLISRRAQEVAYWLGASGNPEPVVKKGNVQPTATEIGLPGPKKWEPGEIIGAGTTVATIAGAGFSTSGFLSYVFGGILILAVVVIAALAIKRFVFRG
jgi:lysozyme